MTSNAAPAVPPSSGGRLRLVPAPQPRVPYDDECSDLRPDFDLRQPAGRATAGTQGTLALAFPLTTGLPAVPAPSPRLRVVTREVAAEDRRLRVIPGEQSADAPARGGGADVTRWATVIAQAIVEAEVGDRPMSQLVRWTTDEVHAAISARCASHGRRTAPARRAISRAVVTSVHICQVTEDVAETCATVRRNGRARAVAMRLERVVNGWRCTAVSLG